MNERERIQRFKQLLRAAQTRTGVTLVARLDSKAFGQRGVAVEPVIVLAIMKDWHEPATDSDEE